MKITLNEDELSCLIMSLYSYQLKWIKPCKYECKENKEQIKGYRRTIKKLLKKLNKADKEE